MKSEIVEISKIKQNTGQIKDVPKNPRFIKDERAQLLEQSIIDDPEMLELREIIVYDNFGELVCIAGNMRLRTCKNLKHKTIPCKILPSDTPAEKLKRYIIKDNVPFGENDWEAINEDWNANDLAEWGLDIPEFDGEAELDYSDKNKEIDTDEFSDKMELKFVLSSDEYQFIQNELSKINANKELALLTLLKYEL